MQIGKDCEPYLRSADVIEILQSSNIVLQSKVFDCLHGLKKYFFTTIPLQHYSIPHDILLMCAEDALGTAERIFFTNVKNNSFKPITDSCIGYVAAVFKTTYFKLYKRELERKNFASNYSSNEKPRQTQNEGEKKLLKKSFLSLKINLVLKKLSEEDNRIYKMIYVEQLSRKEIAELLNIQHAAVSNKIYRLHCRFAKEWEKQNNTN